MARPTITGFVSSRLPINLKDKLQEIAANEEKSLSKLIKELIELGLQKRNNKKPIET
ncbi:MAG: ribbon-helix-helix protein, CopG family [Candidatus Helarchaeota archaeon]|nr:ribbon-helix-helix protein, CopG family [Candidatus Helarchaeota archaeon]